MECGFCGHTVTERRDQVLVRSRAVDIGDRHGVSMARVPAIEAEIRSCPVCDWIVAGEMVNGEFVMNRDYIPLAWLRMRQRLYEQRKRREGDGTPPHEPGE